MQRILLAALALTALAGCSDGGGGTSTDTATATGTATNTTGPAPPPQAPAMIYINGTVTGGADCSLAAQLGAAQGNTQPVPMEAWNGTFELTFQSSVPVTALCIAWGDDQFTRSLTGPVPSGVTEVTVAADAAQGAMFSIAITPAMTAP